MCANLKVGVDFDTIRFLRCIIFFVVSSVNGQSQMLQCNAGYVIDAATTCTCDITGANPT